MEHGRVKWFDPAKGYGFITLDAGEQDVYFHKSDGARFSEEGGEVEFDYSDFLQRIPKKGDRIAATVIFSMPRGPKAVRWGFEEDYKRILKALKSPITYRIVKVRPDRPEYIGKMQWKTAWEGKVPTHMTLVYMGQEFMEHGEWNAHWEVSHDNGKTWAECENPVHAPATVTA